MPMYQPSFACVSQLHRILGFVYTSAHVPGGHIRVLLTFFITSNNAYTDSLGLIWVTHSMFSVLLDYLRISHHNFNGNNLFTVYKPAIS